MGPPRRTPVEGLERRLALVHAGKAAQPDEAVRIVEVAEGPEHRAPGRRLRLQELGVEQVDQLVPPAALEGVLTKLDQGVSGHDRRSNSMVQLVSQFDPSSAEKAWAQRQARGVIPDQMNRTRIGRPSSSSAPKKVPTPASKRP